MPRYFTVNTIAELICLIVAIICVLKQQDKTWKSLIIFLTVTVLAEMAGIYVKKALHQPNAWIYNLLLIVQAFFYIGMFKHLLYPNKRGSYFIITISVLLFAVYVYETITNQFFGKPNDKYLYNNISNTVFAIVTVFCSLYYLYFLLKDDAYVMLGRSANFWWVAGALFFYFGSTICNIFYFVSAKNLISTYYLYNVLNVFLYSCWSYAFICKRWLEPNLKN